MAAADDADDDDGGDVSMAGASRWVAERECSEMSLGSPCVSADAAAAAAGDADLEKDAICSTHEVARWVPACVPLQAVSTMACDKAEGDKVEDGKVEDGIVEDDTVEDRKVEDDKVEDGKVVDGMACAWCLLRVPRACSSPPAACGRVAFALVAGDA